MTNSNENTGLSRFDLLEDRHSVKLMGSYIESISLLKSDDVEYSEETMEMARELIKRMIGEREAERNKPRWSTGPWQSRFGNTCHSTSLMIWDNDGGVVAEVSRKDNADANANLISVAPDMYDALKEVVAYFEVVMEKEGRIKYAGERVEAMAEDAIRLAIHGEEGAPPF